MRKIKAIIYVALFSFTVSASADTYVVTVDTSLISGTSGSLDFNFTPGLFQTQSASSQMLGFTSDGVLAGSPELTGDVSGALPTIVTVDNETGYNDYFEGFTYSSTLSFDVSLYGPVLSSPDGVAKSGSSFAFSMFSDAAGTIPALTNDTIDGYAFIVNVNLDGSTTVIDYSNQATVRVPASITPEPENLLLVALGVGFIALLLRLRLFLGNK